jgi:hypothetical protein
MADLKNLKRMSRRRRDIFSFEGVNDLLTEYRFSTFWLITTKIRGTCYIVVVADAPHIFIKKSS